MSELEAILEARRRRSNLANLISDDDGDDQLLAATEDNCNINMAAAVSGNDDTKHADARQKQRQQQSGDVKKNLPSPSSLTNDQHYRPFVERKLKPTTNISGGVGSRTSPPLRLSSDEPSDEENSVAADNNKSLSPRQRYLQQKQKDSNYGAAVPATQQKQREMQMKSRDRWKNSSGSVDRGNDSKELQQQKVKTVMKWNHSKNYIESGDVTAIASSSQQKQQQLLPTPPSSIPPRLQQQQSTQSNSLNIENNTSQISSTTLHGRNAAAFNKMATTSGKREQSSILLSRQPPSPPPQSQQSIGGGGSGAAPPQSQQQHQQQRTSPTPGGFFSRTSPPLRTSSSASTGSLNSFGSNSNIIGGGVKRATAVVDWPSSAKDDDEQQPKLTAPQPLSSTTQQRQIGGRNTNQTSFSKTVGGRIDRTGYASGSGGGGASSSSNNPEMLRFMAKKYKETKDLAEAVVVATTTATTTSSPSHSYISGSSGFGGRGVAAVAATTTTTTSPGRSYISSSSGVGGGGSDVESPLIMERTMDDRNKKRVYGGGGGRAALHHQQDDDDENMEDDKMKITSLPSSSPIKSDIPEFMGFKLRKTTRGISTSSDSGTSAATTDDDHPPPQVVRSSSSAKQLFSSSSSALAITASSSPVANTIAATTLTVNNSVGKEEEKAKSRNDYVQRRWQPQQQQQQQQQQQRPATPTGGIGNVMSRYPPAVSAATTTTSRNDKNEINSNNNREGVGRITNSRFHVAAALAKDQEFRKVESTSTARRGRVAVDESSNEQIENDSNRLVLREEKRNVHPDNDKQDGDKNEVMEKEAERGDNDGDSRQDGNYIYNNYDTAVIAAKDAITASNLNRRLNDDINTMSMSTINAHSRQQPWHKKNKEQRLEESYGESILDDKPEEDEEVNDPGLRMEPSPSDDMLLNKSMGYPFLDSLVSRQGEGVVGSGGDVLAMMYSADPSEDGGAGGVNRHYMSPASTTEEEVPDNNRQAVNSFFDTSFLVANDEEDENKNVNDDENAVGNLFGGDPFDPFNTGVFSYQSPLRDDNDEPQHDAYTTASATKYLDVLPRQSPTFEANFDNIPNNESEEDVQDEEIRPRMSSESMMGLSRVSIPSVTETSYEMSPKASNDTMGEFKVNAADLTEDSTDSYDALYDRPIRKTVLYKSVQQQSHPVGEHDIPGSFIMRPIQFSLDMAEIEMGKRTPAPKLNPLSGNLIVCKSNGKGDFLVQEVDISKNKPVTVLSTNLLTNVLKMRLARSSAVSNNTKIVGVSSILSLAAGVHRVQGRARVRVAALAEVLVVGSSRFGAMEKIRLVAVWKWGYNPGGVSLVSLQSVLTTKTIDEGSHEYNPNTLQVADGLLFLGGREISSGPVVFIAKPAVRDSWTSVPITNSTAKTVSALATTNDANPCIALGFSDGCISIWSYDLAVRTNRISAEQVTSLLRLLYHIRGELDVSELSDSDCLWPRERFFSVVSHGSSSKSDFRPQNYDSDPVEEPDCTSLSWIKPSSSGISSLPLLAASFSSGIAIYLVPSSYQYTSMPGTIPPLAQAKFLTNQEKSDIDAMTATTFMNFRKPKATLTWYDLGPRSPPCLAMTFEHEKVSFESGSVTLLDRIPVHRLCLCAVDIPWYGSVDITNPEAKQGHRAIGILCQNDVDLAYPAILDSPTTGSILCYTGGDFCTCQPSLASSTSSIIKVDGFFTSLSCPVSSCSLGLDSTGSIYFGGVNTMIKSNYLDTVLSVFPLISYNGGGGDSESTYKLKIPSQRYWLLISNPGDGDMGVLPREQRKVDSPGGGDDVIKTGAVTDVLCELTCGENSVSGLVPARVVKELGGRRVAVLYSAGFFGGNVGFEEERSRTHTRIPPFPLAYAVIDLAEAMKHRGATPFTLRHGRDVAFLPPSLTADGFYCSSLVVLDPSGSSLSMTTAISSSSLPEGENEVIVESIGKCSLQYEGIDGRRVFVLLNGNNPEVLVSGYSELVGLPCLVLCKHSLERDSNSNQLTLLEAIDPGQRLWLKAGEDVITLVELPRQNQTTRANIAVATQQRVMILSVAVTISIVAEVEAFLTCTNLSPVGSHCVAFSCSASSCGGGTTRIMYLSCLKNTGNHGVIATLPSPRYGKANSLLTAIRPDRIVYSNSHGGIRRASDVEDDSCFIVPLSQTRPVFLLEPLIANALCQDKSQGIHAAISSDVQTLLRVVIEKFGRKVSSFPHRDNEGIGLLGIGVTMKVYEMLVHYGCKQAASLLLTGNLPGDISSQPTILPPWIPMSSKLMATKATVTALQVVSSGDSKLAEYLRNPDRVSPSALPKPNDPSCTMAKDLAINALSVDNRAGAAKLLDFSGQRTSESDLLQLVLRSSNKDPILRTMITESGSSAQSIKDYAEILRAIGLKMNDSVSVSQLAPSVQSIRKSGRARTGVIDASLIDSSFPPNSADENVDPAWKEALNENRHVWSTGPFGKKEKLLQLDKFDDWLGRCRPNALGEEGVAMAADTGERALANILLAAAQEDVGEVGQGESEDASDDGKRGIWIDGVGEGRLDEDNLSLYLRFSEGADEDCNWRADGFADLTKHKHQALLYGSELASLEATTSGVDEGEEGKVRLLYDIVYNDGAPREHSTGVAIEVSRGGNLDIGMLHSSDHKARQRCTLEMWYHLPQAHMMTDEIILMRRSLFYEENNDASKVCLPDERHNTLWELSVLPTGLLELRTGAGSVVTSAMFINDNDDGLDGLVSWERESGGGGWNHVCVTFSSVEHDSPSMVSASVMMNGVTVVSSALLFVDPFGFSSDDVNQDDIDDALEKTILVFGIGPSVGFRMTDIRVWACQRSEEDVKTMMYEYLKDAEMKRKLKVNIRKTSSGVLAPPERKKFALAPPRTVHVNRTPPRSTSGNDGFGGDIAEFELFGIELVQNQPNEVEHENSQGATDPPVSGPMEPPFEVVLSDLLSTTVKKSAAAAIIRGPPAARHFGGNRGGLAPVHTNFGLKPDGVGPIAITGPDKSLVFFSDRDPPGRTYPIGASGAVLSDIMDENYSEYMCCFLAKEKRMIIFELTRKTVVVELQMKTKLNFWRYVPPEAHGGELAFVLITPIGGFHWKPLENPPRPRQVWKRSPELESKKVITYEEGGSNGQIGVDARSTVALLLVSSPVSSDANVEAYCISMDGKSSQLLISDDIQGAALCCPSAPNTTSSLFLPFIVTIQNNELLQLVLTVEDLKQDSTGNKSLMRGVTLVSTILDLADVSDELFNPPPMSMGLAPEVLICCNQDFIVVVIRRQGLILAYDFSSNRRESNGQSTIRGDLSLVTKCSLGRYVVDAAIRPKGVDQVELVALLRESNDSNDGRIATINIARHLNTC